MVQIKAWRWPADKPLSETLMARLSMHICIKDIFQWRTSVKYIIWLFYMGINIDLMFLTHWGWMMHICITNLGHHYTLCNEVSGGILDSPCLSVCPSVRLSVCLSVCLLTFRVRPVASTFQDGFFPYLVQVINIIRGCVAYDDPWPWLISSRSFSLDLENRVRSVASTVLDGLFLYLAQMITIIRGCVTRYVFYQNLKIWISGKFLKFFGLHLEKKIYSSRWILSIFSTNDH